MRPKTPIHNCHHRYQDNLYYVKVAIYQRNTSLELQMVLDTGASYVLVPNEVFDALELEVTRTVLMHTPAVAYEARIGIVEKVILDQVVAIPTVEIATTPRKILRLGGLLGGSFLREVGIYLDPRKGLLRFHHDG